MDSLNYFLDNWMIFCREKQKVHENMFKNGISESDLPGGRGLDG